eukprot:2124644-Pyramimonas_sp.AAC.1
MLPIVATRHQMHPDDLRTLVVHPYAQPSSIVCPETHHVGVVRHLLNNSKWTARHLGAGPPHAWGALQFERLRSRFTITLHQRARAECQAHAQHFAPILCTISMKAVKSELVVVPIPFQPAEQKIVLVR